MKVSGFLFAAGAALTWGLVYTLDQKILVRWSPLGLLFIDSVLSVLVTAPFLIWRSSELRAALASTQTQWGLILASLILAVVANYLIYSAIRVVGASTASIFEITYPLFVVLFSTVLLKGSTNTPFLVGALLVIMGIVVILRWG